jgi:hypothetical protein
VAQTSIKHDMGFMIFLPAGAGWRLTGDARYLRMIHDASRQLAAHWIPALRANWSVGPDPASIIVDSGMNLELMYWSATHGGDPAHFAMALDHARFLLRNHIRPDGSSYHMGTWDPRTGEFLGYSNTAGYAVWSTWSRGQAWAIGGMTTSYRYTRDPAFLEASRRVIDYWMARLPADCIPWSDFDGVEHTNIRRKDSSAAAIVAAALLDYVPVEPDPVRARRYRDHALALVEKLTAPGYATLGTRLPYVLARQTNNWWAPEAVFIWGDFYLLDALNKLYLSPGGVPARPVGGQFDRAGPDDVLLYRPGPTPEEVAVGQPGGEVALTPAANSLSTAFTPLAGDFDGDGDSDLLGHRPGPASELLYTNGGGGLSFARTTLAPTDPTARPAVGDFDADGRDDILWHGPGVVGDRVWYSTPAGFVHRPITNVRGTYRPLVGDYDGNGRDDIFWYAPGPAAESVWLASGSSFVARASPPVAGTYRPLVGDVDGDGDDDIFWYGPGVTARESLWRAQAGTFMAVASTRQIAGSYAPVSLDIDGDGAAEMLFHNDDGPDSVWDLSPTGAATVRVLRDDLR